MGENPTRGFVKFEIMWTIYYYVLVILSIAFSLFGVNGWWLTSLNILWVPFITFSLIGMATILFTLYNFIWLETHYFIIFAEKYSKVNTYARMCWTGLSFAPIILLFGIGNTWIAIFLLAIVIITFLLQHVFYVKSKQLGLL